MARTRTGARHFFRFGFVFGVPYLALYGVNQWIDPPDWGVAPWIVLLCGQIFALGFLFAACAICQRVTRCAQTLRWLPLAYAVALAVVLPAGAAAYRYAQPGKAVPKSERVPSALDILLVQPPSSAFGPARHAPLLSSAPLEAERWRVRFAVASAVTEPGRRPSLRLRSRATHRNAASAALLASQRPPAARGRILNGPRLVWPGWRTNAAHAVVLNVDGIHTRALDENSTDSRPAEWEAMLGRSTLMPPVYAILGETDEARLQEWRDWTERRGGEAVRLRDTERPLFIDAALRIVTEQSEEFGDEALAWRYRPKISFDNDELLPKPVDVEEYLGQERASLDPRKGHISLLLRELGKQRLDSAIYYHVVRHDLDGDGIEELFLDYWWFFPYNPTPVGRSALCKPGFQIPNFTCFDHEADWEGITVVLLQDNAASVPHYAIYAQHESGVAYRWKDLTDYWDREGTPSDRPIVFVALNSHASYPHRCELACSQIEKKATVPLGEGTHDGGKTWLQNELDDCRGTCLKPLPRTRSGKPALWNASPHAWGSPNCLLGISCDRAAAPLAPRYQGRFSHPWKPLRGPQEFFGEFEVQRAKYE
jgi:hypothetical protein